MKTVRRNAKNQIAAFAKRVVSIKSYSLSNCFKGVECLDGVIKNHGTVEKFIYDDFVNDAMRYTRLTLNENGKGLCLHVHSNQWYELELKG